MSQPSRSQLKNQEAYCENAYLVTLLFGDLRCFHGYGNTWIYCNTGSSGRKICIGTWALNFS